MKKTSKLLLFFIVISIVMSTVSVNGLVNSSLEYEINEADKDYIIENLDENYTSYDEDFDFEEAAVLTVKNTYIDEEKLKETGTTLEEYFDNLHEKDDIEGYMLTTVAYIPLFYLDGESEYVVGFLNTDKENEVLDVVFAENNDEGNVLNNEYYDYDTGLVYVSVFDLFKEENDALFTDCVQAQVLRAYEDDAKSEVDVYVNNNGDEMAIKVSEDVLSPEVTIPIDTSEEFSKQDIKVYVNNSDTPLDANDYIAEDENIIIKNSSGSISSIDIQIDDKEKELSIFEKAFNSETAYALSTDSSAITDIFGVWKKEAHVGDYVDFSATGTNAWSATGINYVQTVAGSATSHTSLYEYMINHWSGSAHDYVTGYYDGGRYKNIYRSTYNACYGIKMNTKYIKSSNSSYMSEWLSGISDEIQMGCIEVSTAAFQDMAIDDWLDYTAMVTAVGDNYVAVSFVSKQKTSRGTSNQVMCGTYAIKYSPIPDGSHVNYHVDEGYWPNSNHVESQYVKYEDAYYAQYLSIENEPKRDGYAFIGWSTYNGADEATYDIGDVVKWAYSAPTVDLYAVWKKANNIEWGYSEYGSDVLYVYKDISKNEIKTLTPAQHHYFKFDGYFTDTGKRVTDSNGKLVDDVVEDLISGGAFVNEEDGYIYAHFVDP